MTTRLEALRDDGVGAVRLQPACFFERGCRSLPTAPVRRKFKMVRLSFTKLAASESNGLRAGDMRPAAGVFKWPYSCVIAGADGRRRLGRG